MSVFIYVHTYVLSSIVQKEQAHKTIHRLIDNNDNEVKSNFTIRQDK